MRAIVMMLAMLCMACSQSSASSNQPIAVTETAREKVHPVSGLPIVPLTVFAGKEKIGFAVEVAASPQEQARGLMFRTELNDFAGMIFPYKSPQILGFWMKNTPLPLDIIFIDEDGRIINIAAQTTPYSLDSVYSDRPAMAVLEIAGGRAAQLGIKPGDKVEW
jgi:uncharacterized protein